uniref:Uncharacterized protein n=1 Tax=Plectus sambesii TaxID=2011161 RepID=A0A914XGK2_9BILA
MMSNETTTTRNAPRGDTNPHLYPSPCQSSLYNLKRASAEKRIELVNAGVAEVVADDDKSERRQHDAHPSLIHIHLFGLDGGGVSHRRFSIRHRSRRSSGPNRPSFVSRRSCER